MSVNYRIASIFLLLCILLTACSHKSNEITFLSQIGDGEEFGNTALSWYEADLEDVLKYYGLTKDSYAIDDNHFVVFGENTIQYTDLSASKTNVKMAFQNNDIEDIGLVSVDFQYEDSSKCAEDYRKIVKYIEEKYPGIEETVVTSQSIPEDCIETMAKETEEFSFVQIGYEENAIYVRLGKMYSTNE